MADKPLGTTVRPNDPSSNQHDPPTLDGEKPQHLKAIMASSTSTLVVWLYKGTSTQANEFAGSVAVCLMTPLTPTLHIVSRASGSRSARQCPRTATRGSWNARPFWQQQTNRGVAGRTRQFVPAIVRDDLSGERPGNSSAYLCYPAPVLRDGMVKERDVVSSPSGLFVLKGGSTVR